MDSLNIFLSWDSALCHLYIINFISYVHTFKTIISVRDKLRKILLENINCIYHHIQFYLTRLYFSIISK